jgi:UDP-N-acetylmuramoyl-tripeptide--D-alanyl-D-alanine ligase
MSALTSGTVITYGFQQKANVRGLVTPEGLNLDADRWLQSPAGGRLGMSFKIAYRGNVVPVRLPGVGLPQAYAALAAAAVGISQKMNLVEIGSALRNFEPLPGRMRLIEGIKKTLIIDDTYNAAPASTISALQYLKNVRSSGRKIAVLGDMLELGIYTEEGHREVGQRAAATVDVLVAVGQRAKFIAAAAREAGMSAVTEFGSYEAVGAHLEELLQSYDTVLIKASQRVRLEKVVKEIMAHPEEADKLLVRQGKRWQEI